MGLIGGIENPASGLTPYEASTDISYKPTAGFDDLGSESDQKLLQNTLNILAKPVGEKLTNQSFYPNGTTDINVGTYTGSILGSSPIFAAEVGVPLEVINARKLAQQEYLAKQQEDAEVAQTALKFANISDKVKNNIFLDNQKADFDNFYNENYAKYLKAYGSPVMARTAMLKSQDLKYKMLKWDNLANAYDKAYEDAVAINIDPEAAYNYDEDTRKIAAKFLQDSITFDPNNLDNLLEYSNTMEKRKNLKTYAAEIGTMVGEGLVTDAVLKNIISDLNTGKTTNIMSGDYDIFETISKTNEKELTSVIDGAVKEYETSLGKKVTEADKKALKYYLGNELKSAAKIKLQSEGKYNAGARVWEHAANKKTDDKNTIKPQPIEKSLSTASNYWFNKNKPAELKDGKTWNLSDSDVQKKVTTSVTSQTAINAETGVEEVISGVFDVNAIHADKNMTPKKATVGVGKGEIVYQDDGVTPQTDANGNVKYSKGYTQYVIDYDKGVKSAVESSRYELDGINESSQTTKGEYLIKGTEYSKQELLDMGYTESQIAPYKQ